MLRVVAPALLVALAGPAAAQDCVHDDALARVALELSTGPRADAETLVRLAREAGSDAPSFRATAFASGDAEARARFLTALADDAGGPIACGEADDGTRAVLVAAPRLGHLEWVEGDGVAVRAELLAELLSPVLYVTDGAGETLAFGIDASPSVIELGSDLALPARIQLVATGAHGPRPVAVLERGAPVTVTLPDDATSRARLDAIRAPGDPSPLRTSHVLDGLATEHAEAVCAEGVVGHELEPGLEPEERIRRRGVIARHVGEVVARAGSEVEAWATLVASPSHLFALRDRRFTDAGIGVATDAGGHTCLVVLLAAWPRFVGH